MGNKRLKNAGRSKSSAKNEPPSSTTRRHLRGIFAVLLITGVILLVGSFFMKRLVVARLRSQAVLSSSPVFSQPFSISVGDKFRSRKTVERLARLGYYQVERTPKRAGEFQVGNDQALIYLHETQLASGAYQQEQLVEVKLNGDSVTRIADLKYDSDLSLVWLQPELLGYLGRSASRATTPKRLDQFPERLKQAVLAIEDERFYSHFGVDPIAILRALISNLRHQQVVQGGSTITQQLAKNLFLSNERTLSRKAIEAVSAVLLETALSKEEIFELYLNQVFLGQEGNVAMHGFGEAARSFFGKNVEDLNLAEAAMLAGIIKAPSSYSPRRHFERANERKEIVLLKMKELGMVTDADLAAAALSTLAVLPTRRSSATAPYFVDYVRNSLQPIVEKEYLKSLHFSVYTGIDWEVQQCAETAITSGLLELEKTYPRVRRKKSPLQAALIAVDAAQGSVLGWVGGRNYQKNQFDRVSSAKRQPGSAFKPFVYLTAFDGELNQYRVARTTSTLLDEPIAIDIPGVGVWEPKNYDGDYQGEVTMRQALVKSLNIPTVQLAQKVGLSAISELARELGFGDDLPAVPSLALGAGEVSPFTLARAYTIFANGGRLIQLRPISSIVAEDETEPLYLAQLRERRVSSEPATFIVTDILRDVLRFGTGAGVRRLGFTSPAAGKTGTSDDTRDSWFVGFTPRLLAAVWVGFDDNSETGLTGAQGALPLWTKFMTCAGPLFPELDFVPPPGVVYRRIDRQSGLLATANCPTEDVEEEVFVLGTEPITPCDIHEERRFWSRRYPEDGLRSEGDRRPRHKPSFFDRLFGETLSGE